jgi:hypothetical protein
MASPWTNCQRAKSTKAIVRPMGHRDPAGWLVNIGVRFRCIAGSLLVDRLVFQDAVLIDWSTNAGLWPEIFVDPSTFVKCPHEPGPPPVGRGARVPCRGQLWEVGCQTHVVLRPGMAGNGAVLRSPLCGGYTVTSSTFRAGLWKGEHGQVLVRAGSLRHGRPSLPPRRTPIRHSLPADLGALFPDDLSAEEVP